MHRYAMTLILGAVCGACKPAPMTKAVTKEPKQDATTEATRGATNGAVEPKAVSFALKDIEGRWVTDCEDDERVYGEISGGGFTHVLVSFGQDHCRMPIAIMSWTMTLATRPGDGGRLDADLTVQKVVVMSMHPDVTAELNKKPGAICKSARFETNVPVEFTGEKCEWKHTRRFSQLQLSRDGGEERVYMTGPANDTDDSLGRTPAKRDRTIVDSGARRLESGAWHPFDEVRKAREHEDKWKEEHEPTPPDSEGLSLHRSFQRLWSTSFQTL